jgi:hypothetical protein
MKTGSSGRLFLNLNACPAQKCLLVATIQEFIFKKSPGETYQRDPEQPWLLWILCKI